MTLLSSRALVLDRAKVEAHQLTLLSCLLFALKQRVQELLSILAMGQRGVMATADGLGGRTPAVGRFLVPVGEGRYASTKGTHRQTFT